MFSVNINPIYRFVKSLFAFFAYFVIIINPLGPAIA